MLTQSEIDAIIAEVEAGTYDVADALVDIAQKQKGEDVRKALYSLAYTLEREGKVGSVDLKARGEIDVLTSELNSFVADHAGTWGETELWSGEAYTDGAQIVLEESCENYDYIDVHYTFNHDSAVRRFPAAEFKDGAAVASSGIDRTNTEATLTAITIMPSSLSAPDGINFVLVNDYWTGTGADVQGTAGTGMSKTQAGYITAIVGVKLVNDLELTDIRNGQDGLVYPTAGNAVRAQVQGLQDQIDEVKGGLTDIEEQISGGMGVSNELKVALLQLTQKVAYIDDGGQTYYQDLYDALYPPAPPKTLVSISAVYTQSGTVYDTDTLDSLKSDLAVTAHYDDQTTAVVTAYTLSGTLETGTSTITVNYGGKTTTFEVAVTHNPKQILHAWDFTKSLTDSVGGVTATLHQWTAGSPLLRTDEGLDFNAAGQQVNLGAVYDRDQVVEIEATDFSMVQYSGHIKLLGYGTGESNTGGQGLLVFRYAGTVGWTTYVNAWGSPYTGVLTRDYFNADNVKITIKVAADGTISLYKDDAYLATANLKAEEKSESLSNLYLGAVTNGTNGACLYNCKITKVTIYKEV